MAKRTGNATKDRAWQACSSYVRTRGCLRTTGLPFSGKCVTCGRPFHRDALDAGHAVAGRSNSGNATLFATKFIDVQCRWWCNISGGGEPKKYHKALVARHGEDYVDRWKARLKQRMIKSGSIDWAKKAAQFKRREANLLKKYNV